MDLPVKYDDLNQYQKRTVREEYIKKQGGMCYYCKASLAGEPALAVRLIPLKMHLFPDGFLKWPVHLHHDHDTGMTLGAVHAHCNGVLWQYYSE